MTSGTNRSDIPATERLIIALDIPDIETAQQKIDAIGDAGRFYKIGYQLMPIGGLNLAQRLTREGKKVFLDFKFHDIGATVERGVKSVCKLGGDFLTVHAEHDVMKGAVAGRGDDPRLKILAVTVLTSLSDEDIRRAGIDMPVRDLVLKRAEAAAQAGVDGVVASAQEAREIRGRFGDDLVIVTPGVRLTGSAADDQKRVVTPKDAIANGADYLVMGRPVVNADNPVATIAEIHREISAA